MFLKNRSSPEERFFSFAEEALKIVYSTSANTYSFSAYKFTLAEEYRELIGIFTLGI